MLLSIFASLILQVTNPFWSYWGDGNAEVSRYETVQNRYGEDRRTEEIMIYVTEPFNLTKQVKSDSYSQNDKNKVQVLKLNQVKDFQTGIYDYNLMTSVFTAIDPFIIENQKFSAGNLIKVTFTGQDWCGHVFHQLNRRADGIQSTSFSYFENESDQDELLPVRENTLFIDNLFIDVRELIRKIPEGVVSIYQSLENTRLFHKPLKIQTAIVTKTNRNFTFDRKDELVTNIKITNENYSWEFIVEKEYPKKILHYKFSKDNKVMNKGTLLKSVRLPYWQLHDNGDEKYLKELGY